VVEWFDDLAVGMRFKSLEKVVTREEIKRFASEFDPQPYHLDEAAAEQTPLKGLAASGWHTAAIAMRLAVEVRPFGPHPLLGLGVDELRWLAPVRPGDKLHLEGEVVELTPSKTKSQGIARIKWTASTNMAPPFTRLLLLASCRTAPLDCVPSVVADSLSVDVSSGHKRTLKRLHPMSALPPKADIRPRDQDVCFGQ
jgi:acyl dehydratase